MLRIFKIKDAFQNGKYLFENELGDSFQQFCMTGRQIERPWLITSNHTNCLDATAVQRHGKPEKGAEEDAVFLVNATTCAQVEKILLKMLAR